MQSLERQERKLLKLFYFEKFLLQELNSVTEIDLLSSKTPSIVPPVIEISSSFLQNQSPRFRDGTININPFIIVTVILIITVITVIVAIFTISLKQKTTMLKIPPGIKCLNSSTSFAVQKYVYGTYSLTSSKLYNYTFLF